MRRNVLKTGRLRAPRTLERLSRPGVGKQYAGVGVHAVWYLGRILALLGVALAIWVEVARQIASRSLFPGPVSTWNTFLGLVRNGELGADILASGIRIVAGFAIGSAVGVACGLALGTSKKISAAIDPYIQFFRAIPPIAWLGTVLLIFGSGERSKILLIVYATFFVVAINCQAGVRAVPRDAVRMARSFGASRIAILRRVVVPASAGHVFVGMRVAMGNSFMTVVVAEMLAANSGLGYLVNVGTFNLDIANVFVGIVLIGALGYLADRVFAFLARRYGGRFMLTVH